MQGPRQSAPVPMPRSADGLSRLRRALGLSSFDLRRAVDLCGQRPEYAEDFLMTVAIVDCGGLAVRVKGDRHAWNVSMAAGRVDALHARLAEAGEWPGPVPEAAPRP